MENAASPALAASPEPTPPPGRPVRQPTTLGHRWVGTLFCLNHICQTVLAEVFADAGNDTYLQPVGGLPLRNIGVPCPKCGRVRQFKTARVSAPGILPPLANRVYDLDVPET